MSRPPATTFASSRPTYYTWLHRYEEKGLKGLEDRSSAPHHMPTTTPTEVVEKMLWPLQHYHFGPEKISMYLKRYYDVIVNV